MELGYIDGVMTVIVLELIGYFIYWRLKIYKRDKEIKDRIIPPSGSGLDGNDPRSRPR